MHPSFGFSTIRMYFFKVVAPAVAIACASSCMSTKSGSTSAAANGPAGLSYSANPVLFIINTAISPDVIGGSVPGKSYAVSPSLPAGLSFNAATGDITGTPMGISAQATYDVVATNSSGVLHIPLVLAVGDTPPSISYGGSLTQTLQVDTAVSISPSLGGGALTGCSSSPTLPSGLTLSPSTCAISGTPLLATPLTGYVISAQNSGGSASLVFNFTVEDIPPALNYPSGITAYRSIALAAVSPNSTGGVITNCSVTPALPAGLSLSSSCVVSGIATTLSSVQTYAVTAYSYDNSTAANATFTLSVGDLAPAISYAANPFSLTVNTAASTITPTHLGGVTTNCTGILPPGLSLDPATCDISGTPTTINSATVYTITPSNSVVGSAVNVTFTILAQQPTTTYAGSPFTFPRYSSIGTITPGNSGSPITSCSSSPTLPTGLTLSSTCVITGTPTVVQAMTTYAITSVNSGGNRTVSISIAVSEVAPVISYSGTPFTYAVGTAISLASPTNTGGTITGCSVSPSLPGGLSLSSACVLSGAPAAISSNTAYTVTATSTAGSGSTAIHITVNNIAPNISYNATPYTYTNGAVIPTLTPANSGGAIVSCTISPAQPAGLSFNTSTCVLSGTPSATSSTTNYTVTATNTGGSSLTIVAIQVNDAAPSITYTPTTYAFTKGTAATVTPTLGGGAVTACSSSPALPSGMSIASTTCVISGTPTATLATASYTITASTNGGSATAVLSLTVNDMLPVISYSGTPFTYTTGSPISLANVTNMGGVITACSSTPTLPAGLSLSNGCSISGTPSVVSAVTNYTITATSSGGTGTTSIQITVNSTAPAITYSASLYTYKKSTVIATLTPANTGGAIVSCAISPTQPTGLAFNTSTCVLSGTPTATSVATNYTVTATNTGGSSSAIINITVNAAPPTISYSPTAYTFTKGTAITTVSATLGGGAVSSCSASPTLPTGLSISNTNCAITGTPTATAATASYTITVASSGGSATAILSITVSDALPVISYSGTPFTYVTGAAISQAAPTNTGGAIVSCTSSPALPAGLSLSSACVISGTPTTVSNSTSYTITASSTGGTGAVTIQITVNSPPPVISFSGSPFVYPVSSTIPTLTPANSGGAIVSCTISPAQPAGLAFSTTTCALSGTPSAFSAATNYTITATNTGGSSSAVISIQVSDTPPTVAYSPTTYTFTKSSAISAIAPTVGGGAIVSCSSSPTLPAGLAIAGTTCVISGTPTAVAATTNYTITATNSGGSATATLSLAVNDTLPVISYSGSPYTFTKNTAISSKTPTNTGGAIVACSVSPTLPGGLSLSSACVITGTPTAPAASSAYSVTASNSAGTASASITIVVNDLAPTLSYAGSPFSYTVGNLVSLSAAAGGGSITNCVSSPTLPAGLSLSTSNCAVSGNPTTPTAAADYVISASNSGGSASATINITVKDVTPSISYAGTPFTFYQNVTVSSFKPTNTGGAIVSCSATSLPAGLSISASTCAITGTPTAIGGAASVTVSATNTGGTGTTTISITVDAQPPSISYPNSPYTFVKGTAITAISPSNAGGVITACSVSPALTTGLSLSTATCVITGTPTAVTSATTYTIVATNNSAASSSSAFVTLQVIDNAPIISYSSTYSNVVETVGTTVSAFVPTNSGGTITSCTASPALPAGLTFNATTCSIAGTLTTVTPQTTYTITATNAAGSSSANSTFTVNDVIPNITFAGNLSSNTFGFKPSTAIPAETPTNSGGAIVSCVSGTTLPAGLNLSNTCVLTGTPTTTQTAKSYVLSATNSGGTNTLTISITINAVYPQVLRSNASEGSSSPLEFTSVNPAAQWNNVRAATFSLWSVNAESGSFIPSLVSADYSTPTPATEPSAYSPRISKDQSQVVYASKLTSLGEVSQSYNIWIMNFDGSDRRQLTFNVDSSLDSMAPVFSADGTVIYFASKMGINGAWNDHATESYNLWMMNVDGSNLTPITQNVEAGLDSQPL